MAVDWRMGLVDSGRNAMDMMTAFETGRQAKVEQNAIRTRDAGRQRASQQLAMGDASSAQQTAMASGDFDYAKAIGSYGEDQRKQFSAEAEALGSAAFNLKNLPVEQRPQAFAQVAQRLQGMFSPQEIAQAYEGLEASGWSDQVLDGYVNMAMTAKDAVSAFTKQNEQYTLAPGSARYDARGNLIVAQPFAPQIKSLGAGETLVEVNPTQPGGGGPASTGAGGALSVDSVLPHIVAQESGGNYAARNASTGALGAYQVMPATGKTLAGRLGLPWRPDLMASDSPEGRAYQDAVGGAAVKEAVDASGGDPAVMAAYYHGGSDRSKWGPKTQQYAADVTARLGGGARVVAQGAPKEGWQTLTGGEAASMGLPAGPVYQRGPNGEVKAVTGTAAASDNGQLTKTQSGVIRTKLQGINAIQSQLGRVEAAMRDLEAKGWAGPVAGFVPGAFDAESDRFDKAVAALAPLIRQLTRVPGEGAMSDYESRLAELTLPSRRSTKAGREETIASMRDLLRITREGYRELLGEPGRPSPARQAAPRASGGGRKPSVSNW